MTKSLNRRNPNGSSNRREHASEKLWNAGCDQGLSSHIWSEVEHIADTIYAFVGMIVLFVIGLFFAKSTNHQINIMEV